MTAAAATVATVFTLVGPAGVSSAMDNVTCDPDAGFLKIAYHEFSAPRGSTVKCYANAGKIDFESFKTIWVDEVSTGNNDVHLHDANGDVVGIKRWNSVKYPNRPPHIKSIEILKYQPPAQAEPDNNLRRGVVQNNGCS